MVYFFLLNSPLLYYLNSEDIVEYPYFKQQQIYLQRFSENPAFQPRCPSSDEWIKKLWYIYTMEYYSAIKRNTFESVLMRRMNLEPIIQSEVSQKEKDKYRILTHIYRIQKDGTEEFIYREAMEKLFILFMGFSRQEY